ncbi:hypothetical protein M514_00423 [Trichuris suis]|uniref:Uncharacterized protein n=1 Tax=Trichuris suis TaxID=68888 RepID=A0A085NRB4_9BILA|nr:hypothetical protein M514_00423 [Trichuris suis]
MIQQNVEGGVVCQRFLPSKKPAGMRATGQCFKAFKRNSQQSSHLDTAISALMTNQCLRKTFHLAGRKSPDQVISFFNERVSKAFWLTANYKAPREGKYEQ